MSELLARVRGLLATAPAGQALLTLATEHGERELLLGPSTDLATAVPTLDWRTAPLAEVFFRHAPGELYELEVNGRTQSGTMRGRWLIADHGASVIAPGVGSNPHRHQRS